MGREGNARIYAVMVRALEQNKRDLNKPINQKGKQMFPPILAKYGITPNPMDMGETFALTYKAVWALDDKIRRASEAAEKGEKVTHPFDTAASKDKTASKVAKNLIDSFLTACDAAIAKNSNVAFFLADMDSNMSAYFTSEVQYLRTKFGDQPARSGVSLDAEKSDRKELVEFLRMWYEAFAALATDEKVKSVVKFEEGKLSLPSIRGRASQTSESEVPTGRYARYLREVWTVDDHEYPPGTSLQEILRAVYQGTDRVGKKITTDLLDLLDKAKGKSQAKEDEPITFAVNGHTVSAVRRVVN